MRSGPSVRLSAHAGASALSGLIASALWTLALGALLWGKPGAALALALLGLGARAACPRPSAELDRETGRGP